MVQEININVKAMQFTLTTDEETVKIYGEILSRTEIEDIAKKIVDAYTSPEEAKKRKDAAEAEIDAQIAELQRKKDILKNVEVVKEDIQ